VGSNAAPNVKHTTPGTGSRNTTVCCGNDRRDGPPVPPAKGGKARRVPLWWDAGTLADLTVWTAERQARGAPGDQPLVASFLPGRESQTLSRHTLRKRFRTACKVLGAARLASLTIHHGRHTFISALVASGASVKTAQVLARHADPSLTIGKYSHARLFDLTRAVEGMYPTAETSQDRAVAATGTDGAILERQQKRQQSGLRTPRSPSVSLGLESRDDDDADDAEPSRKWSSDAFCGEEVALECGGPARTRTYDTRIMIPLL